MCMILNLQTIGTTIVTCVCDPSLKTFASRKKKITIINWGTWKKSMKGTHWQQEWQRVSSSPCTKSPTPGCATWLPTGLPCWCGNVNVCVIQQYVLITWPGTAPSVMQAIGSPVKTSGISVENIAFLKGTKTLIFMLAMRSARMLKNVSDSKGNKENYLAV